MQEKIAIVTDSGCDLPDDLVTRYNINVIPLKIIYPEGEYTDRVDITPAEVYARMPEEIPKTSLPGPESIREIFTRLKQEDYTHVLAIHISSGLSGTYNAVKMIAQDFAGQLTIEAIDTKVLSMATGWLVLEAARKIEDGISFVDIVAHLRQLKLSSKAFFTLETLMYLRIGGRINTVEASLEKFLDLKPIISVNEEGKYYTFCKARGSLRSLTKLIGIAEDIINEGAIKLAVVHSGVQKEAEKILEKLKNMPNVKEYILSEISPALGVHTGPGLLGFCTMKES